jgi:hypothetical protein
VRAGARVGARALGRMGFVWGPYEVHMGSCGMILEVRRCVFLMGYMNFEVPECVDITKYRKIQNMRFAVEDTSKIGLNWVDIGCYGMILEVKRCIF